jgi:hypothetical protein
MLNKPNQPIYLMLSVDEIRARMRQMDNVRAFYVMNEYVRLTDPLHYLMRYSDSEWLFDWLARDLVDDTPYLMYLNIYMVLASGVATVWSECEHGARRSESSVSGVSFPVPTLSIRAACEADFWHLSVHPSDLSVS